MHHLTVVGNVICLGHIHHVESQTILERDAVKLCCFGFHWSQPKTIKSINQKAFLYPVCLSNVFIFEAKNNKGLFCNW